MTVTSETTLPLPGLDLTHRPFAMLPLLLLPRLLGLCDRDPNSVTYGCADRSYWHYKILDLPNARLQESAWLFALLYHYPFDAAYYQNAKLRQWIVGMVDFWLKQRHGDGSVDEVYPFERSFCATSFSTLAMTEALLLLRPTFSQSEWSHYQNTFVLTGRWLATHDNPELANQQAASLVALWNIDAMRNGAEFEGVRRQRQQKLLTSQDPAGFFPEYGGEDVGYLTITLSLLNLLHTKTQDKDLSKASQKANDYLARWIQPDGTYDYRKTSRQTQYLYPSGLSRGLEQQKPDLLSHLENGLRQNKVLNPLWMDDRYCIALAIDYLWTDLQIQKYSHATLGGDA